MSYDNLAKKQRVLLTSDIPPASTLAQEMHDVRNMMTVLTCALGAGMKGESDEDTKRVNELHTRLRRVNQVVDTLFEDSKYDRLNTGMALKLLGSIRGQIKGVVNESENYISPNWLQEAKQASNQSEVIIEQAYLNLLAEERNEELDEGPIQLVQLSDFLPGMISSYQKLHPHIEFAIFASPAAANTECPVAMKSAIDNLILNAVQSMPPSGGRITATLECREYGTQFKPFEEIDDGVYISVEIEDNGSGIPADVLDRLEHESLTTKETGSGIGLVSARSSMKAHNSHLYIESEEGVGTRVTALIPSTIPPGPRRTRSGVRPISTTKKKQD